MRSRATDQTLSTRLARPSFAVKSVNGRNFKSGVTTYCAVFSALMALSSGCNEDGDPGRAWEPCNLGSDLSPCEGGTTCVTGICQPLCSSNADCGGGVCQRYERTFTGDLFYACTRGTGEPGPGVDECGDSSICDGYNDDCASGLSIAPCYCAAACACSVCNDDCEEPNLQSARELGTTCQY